MSALLDWNPNLYLKFKNQRTQPAVDLVNRIELSHPAAIIDIGCGPGNSTEILQARWPEARILGIDNSPAMIQAARQNHPELEWEVRCANELEPGSRYDLVFSNATIQWIPDHLKLLRRFLDILTPGGVMAIQLPLYLEMPVAEAVGQTFRDLFPGANFALESVFTLESAEFYHNALADRVRHLEIWETSYIHEMVSAQAIMEMLKATGMRPYFELIKTDAEKAVFENAVTAAIARIHPVQASGKVLFPFKRLFILANAN